MPTTPAAVFMRFPAAYAAASTASKTPESLASSHSHGQYARFSALSCSLVDISGVHTTAFDGRSSLSRITPHGGDGAVTPAAESRAPLGRTHTSTPSVKTPLSARRSTQPMYIAASVAGMPIFCATTLWKYVRYGEYISLQPFGARY
eukprot:31547-Pelagococcus_subviridis.AAC.3